MCVCNVNVLRVGVMPLLCARSSRVAFVVVRSTIDCIVCVDVAHMYVVRTIHTMMQSLGASGAIFGLLGAEAILLMGVSLPSFLESIMRTAFFAMLVALLVPNIDHMGHLGVSLSDTCLVGFYLLYAFGRFTVVFLKIRQDYICLAR